MSGREWEPGDVAVMGYTDGPLRAIRVSGCADHGNEDHWHTERGTTADGSLADYIRPLAVIDPEDRDLVRELVEVYDSVRETTRGTYVDHMQAALREFANPTPRRVWTDGDVVQHIDGNYTAQRHDGEWRTTTGGKGDSKGWGSDEYVTNHVEAGRLRVLREQAAEANA